MAEPGITLAELDAIAARCLKEHGARPSFLRLREGLTIAIEPMFHEGGSDDGYTLDDGWSIVTADGSRAAHFEHSVAITEDGPVILTAP